MRATRSLPSLGIALGMLGAAPEPARAQAGQSPVGFRADLLLRQEWTRDIFVSAGSFRDEDRRRLQFRPRLEIGGAQFMLGVGGEFNYSSDENTEPPPGTPALPLIRDNYDSRDARLDLAFARIVPVSWVKLEAGRFFMPVAFTEMIWDRDLRPQGGALTLETHGQGTLQRAGVTGLLARGSHVFEDDETDMLVLSGELVLSASVSSRFSLTGSFVKFTGTDSLETKIRRQNTRVAGRIVNDYEVVDVVGRIVREGGVRVELVGDFCWNTAVDEDRNGIWLAAALGSLQTSLARLDYTYASVDKDATLAAYATDDFFWSTGWQGHRADLGVRLSERSAFHAVGQLQRFKDSPRPEERDHWVKRYRLELRYTY